MRSKQEAFEDMKLISRDGEEVLAWCKGTPAEDKENIFTAIPSYIFVTNARLLRLSINNDGVVSIPWLYVTEIRIARKRLKSTLSFSFRRFGCSSDIDYPAEYISQDVVRAINGIRSGEVSTTQLTDESTTAIKSYRPLSESGMDQIFRMYGYQGAELTCSMCGKSAGVCSPKGDVLSDQCEGCERSFTEIVEI